MRRRMELHVTEPIYKEIKSALQVLHIDKQRLQNEGYRVKNGLWGRIIRATGKPNSLRRRRQFYDVWRKTGLTSQCEPQGLQGSFLPSPAYPASAPQELVKTEPQEFGETDQLFKMENDSEGISRKCNQVYDVINRCLSTDEAVRILTNVDVSKVSSLQPAHPQPGELYLYKYQKGQGNRGQDWTPENALWINLGTRNVPHPRGYLTVRYFVARGEGQEIRRRIYEMSEDVGPYMLVHYLGENSRLRRPRRHIQFGQQMFAQTTPQEELKKVEEELDISDVSEVQKITENTPVNSKPLAETLMSASMEQNPNTGEESGNFLNPKDIMATQMMCRELKDFVVHMSVYPDVIIVAALPEMTEQFQVMLKNSDPCVTHILYYNSTFNLENFYVTPLLFCHNDFEESPTFPLAFHIHQCQKERAHTIFLEELLCLLPDLNSNRFVICTDCEAVVENSVKNVLPNASAFNSFRQVLYHLRYKVMFCEEDDIEDNVQGYMNNLRSLICSETEEQWRVKLGYFSVTWSTAFLEYFQMHLEALTKRSARFTLKALGLPQDEKITSTFQELSMMLIQMMHRKLRLETTVFTAFQISMYFLNEVLRSSCNMGPYKPTPASSRSATAMDDVDFPEFVMTPKEIVHFFKKSLADDSDTMPEQEASGGYDLASMRPMAELIIEKNKISLEPSIKSFFVTGWRGQKYVVKVYPEERCSCFLAHHCCHILAARTAIGLEKEKKEKPSFRLWKMCRTAETTPLGEKGTSVVPLKEVKFTQCFPDACGGDAHNKNYLILEDSSSSSESEEANEDSE
ncbi:hypothetical protein AMEX_G4186 [Astyanax mexicanus]|uniref:SWIM-type domain-containing protein n=1 Tax=Astyanax mexicanus TaxID=7994 RepID=A0A8T2MA97_ASTMX|nr:hypothetical protein AMEX_G4186 [Astyanax mexicanus]